MTEAIFTKGNTIYKLECRLSVENFGACKAKYLFKLMQREKRKRKWCEIKGYERQYRANTDMEDILKYLTKDEIMSVAIAEHNDYTPTEKYIFNS